MDESSFSSLSDLIACSEVIAGRESEKLPNLFLVINGCRFCDGYDDQTLDEALQLRDGLLETNRNSIRERIKAAFPCRSFCAVPWNCDSSYASAVNTFRERIVFEAHPLMFNDLLFDGSIFFQLLSSLVEACSNLDGSESGKIDMRHIYLQAMAQHDDSRENKRRKCDEVFERNRQMVGDARGGAVPAGPPVAAALTFLEVLREFAYGFAVVIVFVFALVYAFVVSIGVIFAFALVDIAYEICEMLHVNYRTRFAALMMVVCARKLWKRRRVRWVWLALGWQLGPNHDNEGGHVVPFHWGRAGLQTE